MGMNYASDLGESLIEGNMRGRIGRRLIAAFYHLAVQVYNDHVVCTHLVVLNAARLDDDQSALTVYRRHVAPGKSHQIIFRKEQIRIQDREF